MKTKMQIKSAAQKAARRVRTIISKRATLVAALMVLTVGLTFAAGGETAGAAGFQGATDTIKGYQSLVKNLMNAIAAVIAVVGAFNVYFKMQNGDQDVKKTIMLTIGGCIAFVALAQALPMFFE